MHRPIAKYVVRLALFASAAAAVACASPTAPAPVNAKNSSLKDITGDTLSCKSGYQILNDKYVCNSM